MRENAEIMIMNADEKERRCSKCDSWMVKEHTGFSSPYDPKKYPYIWWCGCGNSEEGGVELEKTPQERLREHWERMNALEKIGGSA